MEVEVEAFHFLAANLASPFWRCSVTALLNSLLFDALRLMLIECQPSTMAPRSRGAERALSAAGQ